MKIVDVYDAGDKQGKVLRLSAPAGGSSTGTYVGGWHIGHQIVSGMVYLDYKLNLTYYGGGSAGAISFGVGDGRSYYTRDIAMATHASYNQYVRGFTGAGVYVNYANEGLKGNWADVHIAIDMDNHTSELYIDSELIATGTFPESYVMTHFLICITNPAPTVDYDRQALIDDIVLYRDVNEVHLSASPSPQRTSIGFTFDDVPLSVYDNVFPTMRGAGMIASIAVPSSWVNGSSAMSWGQLDELAAAGWELMGHSVNHADHTALDEAQLAAQMDGCVAAILENTSVKQVRGYIFPFNEHNELARQVAWERFDYIGASGYDLNRYNIATTGTTEAQMYKLTSLIMASQYSYGGHIDCYSHNVVPNATGSNIDLDAWNLLMAELIDRGARVITPSKAIMTRNANAATVTGDATAFEISYPTNAGNFRDGRVYVTLTTELRDGQYVFVRDDSETVRATVTDGIMGGYVQEGSYVVMTLASWQDQQVNDFADKYGWVIAGLAGCAALAAYIMGYRHPVILAIAAILLIAAALMHYGVL